MYSIWDFFLLASIVVIFILASFWGWWLLGVAVLPYLALFIKEMQIGERLRQSEERYTRLVEASPEAILVNDLEGKIRIVDSQALALLGLKKKSEIIGKSGFEFIVPEDHARLQKILGETIEKGRVSKVEYTTIRKDGTKFATMANAAVIRDASGKPESIMIVARDVSREKEIDKAKSEFYAMAAHELRTPLTTLRWDMELINDQNKKLEMEQIRVIAARMYRQTLKIIEVVNTMLDTSLLEQGMVRTRPRRVKLRDILAKAVEQYRPAADRQLLRLEESIGELGQAFIDPWQLGEVVGNLIANAIKYSKPKESVKVSATRQSAILHIEVEDRGVGIPNEEQPLVFTKFYRTDVAKKMDPTGSGLGLYSIKTYVEAWGGSIRFVSATHPKSGTTFYIDIPLKEVV